MTIKTIDQYLAALGDDQRAALEKLRKDIRAAAPAVEECISYQIPAFRLDGKLLGGSSQGRTQGLRHQQGDHSFSVG